VVEGQAEAVLVEEHANQVYVDPYTAEILMVRRGSEAAIGHRLIHTASPIHFGRFGGLATKIIWTVAGAFISLGILSGATIWWMRVGRGKGGFFKKKVASTLIMGAVTLGVIALTVYSTIQFISAQLSGPAGWRMPTPIGQQQIGPWSAVARHHGESGDGKLVVSVAFDGNQHSNFKSAKMWIGSPDDSSLAVTARRTVEQLQAELERPTGLSDPKLCLAIEHWEGTKSAVVFSLPASLESQPDLLAAPPAPTVPTGVKLIVAGFVIFSTAICLLWMLLVR
jgi:hypothetical protein